MRKEARAALGFTGTIVGRIGDPAGNWAQRWSEYFWQYACQGHPTDGEVGIRSAFVKAYGRVRDEIGVVGSGLDSYTFVGDQADFKLYPARENGDA